jgi:hypothetical protein
MIVSMASLRQPSRTLAWRLVAALAIGVAYASAQGVPVVPTVSVTPPMTERAHPDLGRLRERLLDAIANRRIDQVRAVMAPTIRDQDDEVPADELLRGFGELVPGEPLSEEWQAFEQALRLGGVLQEGRYVLPFIEPHVAGWPSRREQLFVAGRSVAVRAAPEAGAPILTRLSYAFVADAVLTRRRSGSPASGCASWAPLAMPDGATGWVCATYVRHVSGLYYAFDRVDHAWKLTRLWSVTR